MERGSAAYPPLLRQIPDAPQRLYVRGRIEALQATLPLAVVGTRAMTNYGERVTRLLAPPLAAAGATIVSGLALGIDAAAHEAALAARGTTVAVLGGGVDDASIGPRANFGLARRILQDGGALVSEYPPGTSGQKHHFPARNRIIAGLSKGLLVIEAAAKSGALLTAQLGLDYNRDVFAVPGPITQTASAGANRLLQQGATPVTGPQDILDRYGIAIPPENPLNMPADPDAAAVLKRLNHEPQDFDGLTETTGLPAPRLLAALTALELSGAARKTGRGFILYR